MAQIDSSIYNNIQSPDIFGSIQKGISLRQMIDKNSQDKAALEKQGKIEEAYKSGYVTNPDGSVTKDVKKIAGSLGQLGAYKEADEVQRQDLQDQQSKLKAEYEKSNYIAQTLNGVKDQSTYDSAKAHAQQMGLDVSKLPPAYDPNFVKQTLDQTLTYQQSVENQLKAEHNRNLERQTAFDNNIKLQELNLKRDKNPASEGFKALDKDYAKDYNDWTSSSRASLDKNLARLEAAKMQLNEDKTLTGSFRGAFPDFIRNSTNEKAISVRDDVRAAAQGALKATLGSAFTEKEGERIMNQAYNEKLSPEENIRKIDAAITELKTNKDNNDRKASYFQKYGSLKGLDTQSQEQVTSKTIRMKNKAGEEFDIPLDKKGEAIASGLSVK